MNKEVQSDQDQGRDSDSLDTFKNFESLIGIDEG